MALDGKRIVLGITGSIAAYKAADLARRLVKAGAEVQPVMTAAAARFIPPLTIATLAGRPVLSELFPEAGQAQDAWTQHVELGLWADAVVIAPATAQTLATLAGGFCDSVLAAVVLSARCPVMVAPAMDHDMWAHPATRRNVAVLEGDGVEVVTPAHGELASGLVGDGRLPEPEDLVARIESWMRGSGFGVQGSSTDASRPDPSSRAASDLEDAASKPPTTSPLPGGEPGEGAPPSRATQTKRFEATTSRTDTASEAPPTDVVLEAEPRTPSRKAGAANPEPLEGRHVLVTAGPTREAIDPVRFLSNGSTGAMGFALAAQAAARGARVTLLAGPVALETPPGVDRVDVVTADDLLRAALEVDADVVIAAAAVSDYAPAEASDRKLKKGDGDLTLTLRRTPDVLAALAERRRDGQTLVGFALETHDGEAHARAKLERKGLDWIALNVQGEDGAGMGSATNRVTLLGAGGQRVEVPTASKAEVAAAILDAVA